MKKRSHWIFAFVLCFIFVLLTGYLNLNIFNFTLYSILIMIIIILFYSILPDIDHKSGTMTWLFIGLGIIGLITGIIQLIINTGKPLTFLIISTLLLISVFIASNFTSHRGIIHTIQVGIISVIPLWFLFDNFSYCLIAYLSWHSHLLGDGYLFKIK